ncbi:hypothetical protein [Ancylobacter rudongensis]|uniref:Lipoprotein n=1 Tax=Ancylobacter rudongensis TaxID=177413 RepID=A0A1G4UQY0_9HYPH|nr:hypothetical protein [Ancylobacter rudongensis]SCW95957.1 hypothetical protein SAMN05660859_0158 [Ancylobacter rudongensis]
MKKILIVTSVTIIALGLAGCEDGSYFSPNTTQMKSDKVGRLEATGEDVRVYEFTPQTAPKKQCAFVAGENKGGLVCWDK